MRLRKNIILVVTVLSLTGFIWKGNSILTNWNAPDSKIASEKRYILNAINDYKTGLGRIEELYLAEIIASESNKYNIDPVFIISLIEAESSFFNWRKSNKGAVGLMQIRTYVGKDVAKDLDIEWKGEQTLLNPYANVKMGIYYFAELKNRFDDTRLALAAYNAGPTYVADTMRDFKKVPLSFADKVFYIYQNHQDRFASIMR